jgi:histidinol dehydrogenase
MLYQERSCCKGYCQFKIDFVENDTIALALINEYGPEHFIICTQSEEYYSDGVYNAGSVFIGNFTPESAGDYASGTNHTTYKRLRKEL